MASINRIPRKTTPTSSVVLTHEGGVAHAPLTPADELRRAVLGCFLWEDQFYESGKSIADRIVGLVAQVNDRSIVGNLADEARNQFNLRHVPLLIISAMVEANLSPTKAQVAAVLQRPDEMGELIALLWRNGKRPLPKQVKLGINEAFNRFGPFGLAKYNSNKAGIKLKDVLRLTHPKPENADRAALYKQIVSDTLASPDTWEVALSAGEDKCETFTRLLTNNDLGYLALLRNLRNMEQSGVNAKLVNDAIRARSNGANRVLPFRYVAASRAAPSYANALNDALLACVAELPTLPGRTIVLVDVSASMNARLSAKSDMTRIDAACALASIIPGDNRVFSFSNNVVEVPAYRGLPGIDAIWRSQYHSGTNLDAAIAHINTLPHDRLIVVTDEQFAGRCRVPVVRKAYMINVASYQNGVSYDDWIKIEGFSESVLRFIAEIEG